MKLAPCYKEYLWGGENLKKSYGKWDAPDVTAESWELACHPDGQCHIAEGEYAGRTIQALGEMDRTGFWGTECPQGEFPLLVKLIDAQKPLSIQVHPSDQAALWEKGERGKAEMWYVVDSEPQAGIYFGFSQEVTREEFLQRARDGSICQVLNWVPVAPGDVFYILPGTIHAIGAGIVIAEIQQNSNTTFRAYDYQRLGPDGTPRPLHLERAAAVLDYRPILPEECKANSSMHFPGFTMEEMFSCRYFRAYRVDVEHSASLRCDARSFHHLLCVDGHGAILHNGHRCPIERGESYFLPAALGAYQLQGTFRVLLSRI